MKSIPFIFICFLSIQSCTNTSGFKPQTIIHIEGNRFLINKKAVDIFGIRVASASQSEEYTNQLLQNLNDYEQHGVNAITVFLQGSSGGFSDPFTEDGTGIDSAHLSRMKKIIEACDQRGMVVIAGIFYQRAMKDIDNSRNINSFEAVQHAVGTTTKALQEYKNIVINIANEQNSGFYKGIEFVDFNDPSTITGLCQVVHETDPDRLVGGGGYNDSLNVIIGRHPEVDVLLFDTFGQDIEDNHDSGWHYDYFVKSGVVEKPVVNVEMFGGWTKDCIAPTGEAGYYSRENKKLHLREIDAAAERPGLSVFFHSNPWCQGPSIGQPIRFDLAGQGEMDDLGIRWWFEYVRSKSK